MTGGARAGSWALTRAVALAGVAGLGACEGRQRAAESESILAFLPSQPTPAQAAAWFFDPYDPDKRFRGTVLLANAPFGGEPAYLNGYVDHLDDADSSVRAAAAFALGMHGGPEHAPLIAPLLADPDRLVRLNAARALQRLHNPEAIPALVERLDPVKEPEGDIRAEAAGALGQYAQTRVVYALIGALADERFAVTRRASDSLGTLTGQSFGDDRHAWSRWMATTRDPFARRTAYIYPVYSRKKTLLEHVPLWPDPPNEQASTPAGMTPVPGPAGRS
ncbi:MAG TPA: HEAT repeat domain-containing protein [Phycisphaerales bacterium]|nr:HEAT repeat domain-containing protein [Phycisphaerales bacterium]